MNYFRGGFPQVSYNENCALWAALRYSSSIKRFSVFIFSLLCFQTYISLICLIVVNNFSLFSTSEGWHTQKMAPNGPPGTAESTPGAPRRPSEDLSEPHRRPRATHTRSQGGPEPQTPCFSCGKHKISKGPGPPIYYLLVPLRVPSPWGTYTVFQ